MEPEKLAAIARGLRRQGLRGLCRGDAYFTTVKKYYEQVTPLLLETFGHTYQVALFDERPRASNLSILGRAGVADGMRILDAGCGCGGPAIDWLDNCPGLSIDGITVSSSQVDVCGRLSSELGYRDRWRTVEGDFHQLPFPDQSFDGCLFIESSGHSDNPVQLYTEALRVLKPGGFVYLKEPYLLERSRAKAELLAEFEAIYTHKLVTLDEAHSQLEQAGFAQVESQDISDLVTTAHFAEAMRDAKGELTEFGEQHAFFHAPLPIIIGEIRALKSG